MEWNEMRDGTVLGIDNNEQWYQDENTLLTQLKHAKYMSDNILIIYYQENKIVFFCSLFVFSIFMFFVFNYI